MIFSAPSTIAEAEGRRFDRLRIVQDGQTFGFVHDDYQRLGTGAAEGIRAQQDAGLFALPANARIRSGEAVAAGAAGQRRRRRTR